VAITLRHWCFFSNQPSPDAKQALFMATLAQFITLRLPPFGCCGLSALLFHYFLLAIKNRPEAV